MRALRLCSLALFVAACAGGQTGPAAPGSPADEDRFAAAARTFHEAELAFWPHEAVALGYHEHDGVLPDRSPAAVRAEIARLRAAVETFEAFAPDRIARRQRLERAAILARARRGLFELTVLRAPERDPIAPLRALDLSYYAGVPYAPAGDRARAVMELCEGASAFLDDAEARISAEVPKPWIDAARAEARALSAYAKNAVAPALAEGGGTPIDGLESSLERCAEAAETYAAALARRRDGAPASMALGRDALAAMWEAEGMGLEVDTIRALAQKALELARDDLAGVAEQIDPGLSLAEAIAFEKLNKPAADEVLPVATQQLGEVRASVEAWELAPIPSELEVIAAAAPPRFRHRAAAIRAPGPAEEGELPAAFFVAAPDPRWPESEREGFVLSIGDLLVASIREAWPGRLVHHLAAARAESEILAAYCPETSRAGWAHYAEGAMWDAGLADGEPRVHAALLTSKIQRLLRLLTVLDIHTGQLDPAEAARRFEEVAFLDAATARREAARAVYEPRYAGAALGRLAIETLHLDWRDARGGDADRRAFHDALLEPGCAPLLALRAHLLR